MVALAILGISLVALADLNVGAVRMHAYAKQLSIGTLLARGKMLDLEQKLMAEGVPVDDEQSDGDFSEEGFPSYRWEAQIIRPRTENLSTDQILGLMTGGMEDEKGGGLLPSFFGGGGKGAKSAAGPVAGQAGGALVAGAFQMQAQQFIDGVGKMLREVRLTVFWKDGEREEKFTVVTHPVVGGAGSDVAESSATATGGSPGGGGPPPGGSPPPPWSGPAGGPWSGAGAAGINLGSGPLGGRTGFIKAPVGTGVGAPR